jgi:hypothetical protein
MRRVKAKGSISKASAVEAGIPPHGRGLFSSLAWALAVSVSTVVDAAAPVAMDDGAKTAVTPVGKGLAERLTGYTKIGFIGVNVMV